VALVARSFGNLVEEAASKAIINGWIKLLSAAAHVLFLRVLPRATERFLDIQRNIVGHFGKGPANRFRPNRRSRPRHPRRRAPAHKAAGCNRGADQLAAGFFEAVNVLEHFGGSTGFSFGPRCPRPCPPDHAINGAGGRRLPTSVRMAAAVAPRQPVVVPIVFECQR